MVRLDNVVKTYQTSRGPIRALDEVTLSIEKGQFVVIRGPSGSGKTTLLLTIAGMLRPTSGTVSIEGHDLYAQPASARAKFRAENIGFVFQMFHLVPYLNIAENILLAGGTVVNKNSKARTDELIQKLGLPGRTYHKPAELSAGEKQRTAVARALLNCPKIVLADEPTGNLDPDNAVGVLRYLADFHQQGGTVILATHGPAAKDFADRVVYLQNGKIQSCSL